MTIWSVRIACWIPKATNTHSGCVLLIAFPLQQWLHERVSMLRYTYSACCGLLSEDVILWDNMASNVREVSELERLWKDVVVAGFMCLHFLYEARRFVKILSGENLPPDRDLNPESRKWNDRNFGCRNCSNWNNEKGNKQKYSSVTPCRLVNTRSLQTVRSSIGSVIHQYVGKYVPIAVPALAHRDPDCDPYGCALKADSHIACRAHVAPIPFPWHAAPLRV
jgi:hypothetical protein